VDPAADAEAPQGAGRETEDPVNVTPTLRFDLSSKPKGCLGKIGRTLFFGLFALFGVGMTVALFLGFVETAGTYTRPRTPCVIRSSEVVHDIEAGSPHQFRATYVYEVDGREHVCETAEAFTDCADAERLLDKYPAGASAVCYVDPSNPAEAVLERKTLWVGFFVFFPLIFVAVGVGGLVWTWRKSKPRAAGPVSAKARKFRGEWIALPLSLVFLVVGPVLLHLFFIRPVLKVRDARQWAEVPCTVLWSRVLTHQGEDSTTYSVDILYAYEYGRTRSSNRRGFVSGSSSGREGKEAVVARFPKGKQTVCYVNPRDPAEAVLHRGYSSFLWFAVIPLAFIAAGGAVFVSTVRKLRRRAGKGAARGAGAARLRVRPPAGLVELKAPAPVRKLVGVLFLAAFWNGIVSVFVWQAVKGWQQDRPDWFLTVFLVPFVLIGLGLIGGVFYCFIALFNPRPRLLVSTDRAPLGAEVDVRWEFAGQTGRLANFRITLEGREEVSYQSGKNTATRKHVFATLPVVAVDDPRAVGAGRAALAIPADTMHSFRADHNRIVWELRARGDIRFWPDVNAVFPFTIDPAPVEEAAP